MRYLLLIFLTSSLMSELVLYDFSSNSDLSDWQVEDDVVMGGRSSGDLSINENGHAVFEGYVSLENNGGFSSIQYKFKRINVEKFDRAVITLKGDGKKYQFRVKASLSNYYSYVYDFQTSGDWQEVVIPFEKMYPTFRGRNLDLPNYQGDSMEEARFLIGNGRNEDFKLLIDKIELK